MRLFLEPTEPLLFRTGRPFTAGENNYAETLFPPTPETLQGAVRAAIAAHWDQSRTPEELFALPEVVEHIGDRDGYGRFRITGLALGRRTSDKEVERLFPAPAHLLQVKDEAGKKAQIVLKPGMLEQVSSNWPDGSYYLIPDSKPTGKLAPFNSWLTERGLVKLLRMGEILTKDDVVKESCIYSSETRLGIGMSNATKTTEEGLLYHVQMIRMQRGYGFVVDVRLSRSSSHDPVPGGEEFYDEAETQRLLRLQKVPDGWVTLGGERRAARFEIVSASASELELDTTGNLLYLATPAAFDGGWRPKEWQEPLVEPITAAVGRYQSIGGWKLNPGDSGGQNKVMRRCVPAGSVYFFDKEIRMTRPFTENGWQIGYGIAYTGVW